MVSITLQKKLKTKDEKKAKEKTEGKRVAKSLVELPNKKSKKETKEAPLSQVPCTTIAFTLLKV